MKKIAITTTSFGEYDNSGIKKCEKKGFRIVINPYKRKVNSDELIELAKDAVGIIAGTESIAGKVLSMLPLLKVISRCGAGLENIDVETVKKLNIKVYNTPDAPTLAVAELTMGLILNLLRKIKQMDREMNDGIWKKRMGNLLSGKKVGIIGFGNIGRQLAKLLRPFGCEIAYNDPFVEKDLWRFKQMPKVDLLRWADIITIHVSTKDRILGREELKLMKKESWLINTSRGGVVDEKTLYEFLKKGRICGAALDVFEDEPCDGSLRRLNNVILTPHIGSYAKEARIKMEMEAVNNLLEGLKVK